MCICGEWGGAGLVQIVREAQGEASTVKQPLLGSQAPGPSYSLPASGLSFINR